MLSEIEQILTSYYKEEMIAKVSSSDALFNDAIHLALSDKQPYSWRAAWLIWSAMNENDMRLQEFIPAIIITFPTKKKDGHQRELIKILYNMQLDEDTESQVFDLCITTWEQINKQPSVRHNAFKMLLKISKKYPELWNEISYLAEDHFMETLSPGVRHSIKKILEK